LITVVDLSILLPTIIYIFEMSFASLMPRYNGILTISCIRTLTQIALKLSEFIPLVSTFLLSIKLLFKVWYKDS